MKKLFSILATALALAAVAEGTGDALPANVVRDVVVRQQWPWSTTVTATFTIDALAANEAVDVSLSGLIGGVETVEIPATAVKGVTRGLGMGVYTLAFDPADVPELAARQRLANFSVRVTPTRSAIDPSEPLYMVVDLEAAEPASAVTYLTRGDILSGAYGAYEREPSWIAPNSTPALDDCLIWTGVTNDVYKTTKLVLRRIPAGTFIFGSPTDELGRTSGVAQRETQHPVTLTKDYWIAVFETTQMQWRRIMANTGKEDPAEAKGDTRPVEKVSYEWIRGVSVGAAWPGNKDDEANVDTDSFMGRLRAKTGLRFDLPTEAQWEYACRAGTTTAVNSGKNLTETEKFETCPNLAVVARYKNNTSDNAGGIVTARHAPAGSYRPNAWGLYDMQGNVWEWCVDWYYDSYGTAALTDPVGTESSPVGIRVRRGGSWDNVAWNARVAYRGGDTPSTCVNYDGFRVCVPVGRVEGEGDAR